MAFKITGVYGSPKALAAFAKATVASPENLQKVARLFLKAELSDEQAKVIQESAARRVDRSVRSSMREENKKPQSEQLPLVAELRGVGEGMIKAGAKVICAYDQCQEDPLAEDYKTSLCKRCMKVAYCSKPCQVADWKPKHKAVCIKVEEST